MNKQNDVSDQTPSENQRSNGFDAISGFFSKWGWLISICTAVIALLLLFTPLLQISFSTIDPLSGKEVESSQIVNLTWYFSTNYQLNWIMFLNIALIVLGSGFMVAGKFKRDFFVGGTFSFLVAFVFICLTKFFVESDPTVSSLEGYDGVEMLYGIALSIVFMAISCVSAFGSSYERNEYKISDIAEDGILVALAFCLSFLKIPMGATGGSINLQMLPLMLIALRRGPFHGFICGGIIYALLTCLTDGYGFATFPFDYLIGFGSCCLIGFFRPLILGEKQDRYNIKGELFILLGGVIVTLGRFIGSCLSSMVIYGYTLEASLSYNALYIIPSGLAATAVLMALYGPFARVNRIFPTSR